MQSRNNTNFSNCQSQQSNYAIKPSHYGCVLFFIFFAIKVFHLPLTFALRPSSEPSTTRFVTARLESQSISYGQKQYILVTFSLSIFLIDRSPRQNKKRPSPSIQITTAPLFPRKISSLILALGCIISTRVGKELVMSIVSERTQLWNASPDPHLCFPK